MQRRFLPKINWQAYQNKVINLWRRIWTATTAWFRHKYQRIRENRLGIGYIAIIMLLLFFPIASSLNQTGKTELNQDVHSSKQGQTAQDQAQTLLEELELLKQPVEAKSTVPQQAKKKSTVSQQQVKKQQSAQTTQPSAKKTATTAATAAAVHTVPANNHEAVSFIWPVQGKVILAYGWQKDPVYDDYRLHSGINIAAKAGTVIKAAASGQVTRIYEDQIMGKTVVVDHGDGQTTTYSYCSEFKVKAGEMVNSGTIIATVGNTGIIDKPQLYFEVKINGKTVDPAQVLP